MSAASSFLPPLAQLSARGEHLAVHTGMDGLNSYQSIPSAGESIDEVQLGLDAQTDMLSMDEDRAQIDELEEDPNEGLQYPPDCAPHANGGHSNGEPESAENPKLVEQPDGPTSATVAGLEQAVSIKEPTEEPPQTGIETNSLVSKTDAILQTETLGTTAPTDITDYITLEEQDTLEISGGEDLEFSVPLTEQEISVMAQNLAREIDEMTTEPSEPQSSEQGSNHLDLQTVESGLVVTPEPVIDSHEEAAVPPLRRMDDDTIPVTAHSKDSIIDILNASNTAKDANIQPTTTTEQAPPESEAFASTEFVPEQVDMDLDTQDVVQVEEPTVVSVVAHVEHVQVVEPHKESEGEDIIMEQEQVVVEQQGEPNVDATVEASIDHQFVEITQGGRGTAAQDEPAMPEPTLDDLATASGDVAGPIVTVIEQSTTITEQTPAQETEQPEPPAVDPVPEATMDVTTTSAAATVISANPAVADLVISTAGTEEMEIDPIERAAQIQQEQDATVEATEGETQTTLVADSVATENNTVTDEVPDLTAPKDSNSPSRRAPSQSQSQSQLDPVSPPTTGPVNPLDTQDEEPDLPEENSEPTKPQYQVSLDEPKATPGAGPFKRQTPEWEGFAALNEDSRVSPEPEPSSEPSEPLDEDPSLIPSSASTDKAKEPEEPSNSSTAPARKKKKPRMIMEVVIPIAHSKSKVAKEIKPTKKRGRPAKATKSAKASAPSEPEPRSSSPQRRSPSADTSSVKSESSEPEFKPTPQRKKSRVKHPRLSSSRKRVRAVASGSKPGTRPVHAAHAAKLEVVIPRRPRPSVLKTAGRLSSGNSVKFAPVPPVTGKRKAESEPEVDGEGSDADADGETDEDYEDVEEEPEVRAEVVISPRARQKTRTTTKAKKLSPIKRPRRSHEARKAPAKLPETLSKGSRSPPKRRRLRR